MFSSERMSAADRMMDGSRNAESSVDCFKGLLDRVWMGAAKDCREETQVKVCVLPTLKAAVWKTPISRSTNNTEKRQDRIPMFSTTQQHTALRVLASQQSYDTVRPRLNRQSGRNGKQKVPY
jgi:hypothetical protein